VAGLTVARAGPSPPPSGRAGSAAPVVVAAVGLAILSGPLALLPLGLLAGAAVAALLAAATAAVPVLGAYVLLALTPLVAGVERGAMLPLLRPSEALLGVVLAGLGARALLEIGRGGRLPIRPHPVDVALLAFVLTGSIVPLLWMVARGRQIAGDDVLYASYVWKYAIVYAVVRATVRTAAQVRACLWISMAAAAVVALVAILQALHIGGVTGVLARYYSPGVGQESLAAGRGTSLLSSSFAVADLMVFNLAIAGGLLLRRSPHRGWLATGIAIFVLGTVASGQFSGYLGLAVGVAAFAIATGSARRVLAIAVPVALAAAAALWPVIGHRLRDRDPLSGLPISWVGPHGRWDNLTTYFWPDLFHHGNWLTGVRVAARVPAPETWRQWVWIESGHTWLLWSGGVAFFVACFVFLGVAIRAGARVARRRADAIGVAAIASLTALWVNLVLMTLDVHLTLRGSADLAFALLALALVEPGLSAGGPSRRASAATAAVQARA
jgi:hypothetical protein